MASLSSCLSTFGDAYEQPIFRKGDAASYEEVDILGRLMNSSEMPPHWIAYTSPRSMCHFRLTSYHIVHPANMQQICGTITTKKRKRRG
jgi:hypothetical protein